MKLTNKMSTMKPGKSQSGTKSATAQGVKRKLQAPGTPGKPMKPGKPQGVKPVKRPTTMPIKPGNGMATPTPINPVMKPIKPKPTGGKRPVMTNKPKPRPTTKPIKPGMIKRGM